MFKQITSILLGGFISAALIGQDSYVGVYALPYRTTSVEGEIVGVAPEEELRLEVSVANEEGGEELYIGEVASALELTLRVDEQPLSEDSLALMWADDEERYAFFGELPPEPSRSGILEPGVGLKTQLVIRKRDGSAFGPGHYEVRLTVIPGAVTRANGTEWSGRGGVGGASFYLRAADTPESLLLKRKLLAGELFGRGDYERAAEQYTDILDSYESDIDSWAGLGASLFHLGRYAEASGCLEKVMPAIIAKELRSGLPMLLAESYVALGENEKAADVLRIVVVEQEVEARLEQLRLKVAKRVKDRSDGS